MRRGFAPLYQDFSEYIIRGKINIKDATAIQKHLAEIVTLDSLAVEISDINSDGKVTVKDATAIQKKLVALL